MQRADSNLYKNKVEVSLDGKQVFYLFFGGAVIASLVFVLGVMVGSLSVFSIINNPTA